MGGRKAPLHRRISDRPANKNLTKPHTREEVDRLKVTLDDSDEKIKVAIRDVEKRQFGRSEQGRGGRKVPVALVDPTTEVSVLALNGLPERSWKKRVATDTEFTTFDKSLLGSVMVCRHANQ